MDEKQIEALFSTRREYREDCQRDDAYGANDFHPEVHAPVDLVKSHPRVWPNYIDNP